MNVTGYISSAAKACAAITKAIDDIVTRIRSSQKKEVLIKSIIEDKASHYADGLVASLVYGRDVTYADVMHNLFVMVQIRKGMVMSLEEALSKQSLTQEETDRACRAIYEFVDQLNMAMRHMNTVVALLGRADAKEVPVSLGVLLGETKIYSDGLVNELRYDDQTGHNKTDMFTDPAKREMLTELCQEMKRMIEALCDMTVPSTKRRSGAARTKKNSLDDLQQPLVLEREVKGGTNVVPDIVALVPTLKQFRARLDEYGYEIEDEVAKSAFRQFRSLHKRMHIEASFDNKVREWKLKSCIDVALEEATVGTGVGMMSRVRSSRHR